MLSQSAASPSRRTFHMVAKQETKKKFLSSATFAVVGASKDQTKYGTKVGHCPAIVMILVF